MRKRSKEELDELAFVSQQRHFEIAEDQSRKEILDANAAANPPLIGMNCMYWVHVNCVNRGYQVAKTPMFAEMFQEFP